MEYYFVVCTEKCGWLVLRAATPETDLVNLNHGLCPRCKRKVRLACAVMTLSDAAVQHIQDFQVRTYGHTLD